LKRPCYSQQDLSLIREVWRYYDRGYSLQSAYDLATATDRTFMYLGLRTASRRAGEILERLKEFPQVVEASIVYGAEPNLLLKTNTPDQSEVYHTLVPNLAEMGITGLPEINVVRRRSLRQGGRSKSGGQAEMMAYVMMTVPGKDVGEVIEQLKAFDAVKEASTVYGESDIIARVETPNQEELDDLVMDRIHEISAIESTRTFVVIKSLHWSR
jgi:DNA-binding Lrp family transcriptional regulator